MLFKAWYITIIIVNVDIKRTKIVGFLNYSFFSIFYIDTITHVCFTISFDHWCSEFRIREPFYKELYDKS